MPPAPRQLSLAIWSRFPEPIRRWAGSSGGRRLLRFAPAAALALGATQITYFICFSVLAMTGRTAGAAGWRAGAAVSYGVSRRAWERRGKPRVVRETRPFRGGSRVVGTVAAGAIL